MGVMATELDERCMDLALSEADKAAAAGEVPAGAVVIAGERVVGYGFNQVITLKDPTAHAEIVAMREAAAVLGNYRLTGVTLYSTIEPCAMCAGAMIHARIYRLVFGAPDFKAGAGGSIYNLLTDPRLNHRVNVLSGVRLDECAARIRAFFEQRRSEAK